MDFFLGWEPKEASGVRGRRHRGGALEVGRFPLGGLVRIAIMIPDAIRNGFKNPAREGVLRPMRRLHGGYVEYFRAVGKRPWG